MFFLKRKMGHVKGEASTNKQGTLQTRCGVFLLRNRIIQAQLQSFFLKGGFALL